MRRLLRPALLATWLLAWSCQGTAAEGADENVVKAAVVYNLLLFMQWPEQPPTARSLRLCVIDEGALTAALRGHAKKRVQGQALEIYRLNAMHEEVDSCAAVLVEIGNPAALTRFGAIARHRSLLVIAEGAGAIDRGAMIGLYAEGGRIVFDINQGAMRKSGLAPSSKILRLARTLVD